MRTRDKILILLLTVTLALGAFIFLYSGENQDAVLRFRWLVFNHPLHILSDALESQGISGQGNSTILWYGCRLRSLSWRRYWRIRSGRRSTREKRKKPP